ncbi:thioredoxin reductase [Thermoplasmatales archaeon SCGC AB-539-N05]|nr:thioredoxin reductase [Thermoplasmatales archaeon SCGC AB-539-N05]ENO11799.1 thioredoxin reductase [Thermoplasmatales archaeon SCGC AB-539-C06]
MVRICKHPILNFNNRKKISFYFNDKKISGFEGDSIASALCANDVRVFSHSLKYDRPRGFFCGIGKCSSCLMRVNGIPNVRTCIAPLNDGVRIETQERFAKIPDAKFEDKPKENVDIDILVVGAGPAGLCASIEAAKQGANVLLVDENQCVGGQLIKQTHKFFGSKQEKAGTRGIEIAQELEQKLKTFEGNGSITVMLDSTVVGYYEGNRMRYRFGIVKREGYESRLYEVNCKAVVFSCGAMENMLLFPGNDLPGVYGAGAVQTLMNVYGVKPGKKVIMIGAGNVGLIVSYQLLQAGIKVDRVVEAASTIGGYHVHAAKLRRCGVPIFTSHSIKEIYGDNKVEGAVVVKLDEQWQQIRGSEEKIDCDTICLAVGLTPSIRLLAQVGVKMEFIPEAGGYVALHDDSMQTTVNKIYVAGDSSGIEEASTAMIEGEIAGVSAALSLGFDKTAMALKKQYATQLENLRAGPFSKKPRVAKRKIEKLLVRQHV